MPSPPSHVEFEDAASANFEWSNSEIVALIPEVARRGFSYDIDSRRWPHSATKSTVVLDRASRLLGLLVERLKSSRSASREAELRLFGVPLAEVFKIANTEYPSVIVDESVMAGAPCIAGTRIPVYMILDAIEAEGSIEMAHRSYPDLSVRQIRDAVGFAKVVVECPIEYEAAPAYR